MIIIFATESDLYVFTEPSFDTKKECMSFMINKGPVLSEKLLQVYDIYSKRNTSSQLYDRR